MGIRRSSVRVNARFPRPDIFIIAGQSNAMGFGQNNQIYTGTQQSRLFDNSYQIKDIIDPIDSNIGQIDSISSDANAAGSYWPIFVGKISAITGRPVLIVPCAKGASRISEWQPGEQYPNRTTLYGSMVYRARQAKVYGNLRAVLWHQGESEASTTGTTAAYITGMVTLANAIRNDLGVKLFPCKLQQITGSSAGVTAINLAIASEWANDTNVLPGPDFSDITPATDGLHFYSNAELTTAGLRWANAVLASNILGGS